MERATVPNTRARQRQDQWPHVLRPLPGAGPYQNIRPMFVGGRHDLETLGAYLGKTHPHIELEVWSERAAAGRLRVDGRIADLQTPVRGGSRVEHVIPDATEPPVASDLRFLYEDDHIVVLSKPAPLPVHPSGRFNRNTVVGLLEHVFGETLRPVHRLDASVSGLLVLARSKASARELGRQFEARTVGKRYLAGCRNETDWVVGERRSIDAAIADGPRGEAGRRRVEGSGRPARTEIELLELEGPAALVLAQPISGRTNQIRIHLSHVGLPILGDAVYGCHGPADEPLRLHALELTLNHPVSGERLHLIDRRPAWCEGPGS